MEQVFITTDYLGAFETQFNSYLNRGYNVVPGTMIFHFQISHGGDWKGSFNVVVERI